MLEAEHIPVEESNTSLNQEEYDVFISLGSTCFVATQLKFRKLRGYALPFDYLFNPLNTHLKTVMRCFINHFKNFFLYENLVELLDEQERGTGDSIQYKDIVTGFRFIHHFQDYLGNYHEYLRVKAIFDRRIERLYNIIHKANRVLLLSESGKGISKKEIPLNDLVLLQKNISRIFPNTDFDIHFTQFLSQEKIPYNDPDAIYLKEYTPNIRIFYADENSMNISSYFDIAYAIYRHSMYNYLSLSDKGREIIHSTIKDSNYSLY